MFCPGSRLGPTVCRRFGGNALLAADSSRLNCTGEGGVMSVLTVNISILFVKSMILAINFDAMIISMTCYYCYYYQSVGAGAKSNSGHGTALRGCEVITNSYQESSGKLEP